MNNEVEMVDQYFTGSGLYTLNNLDCIKGVITK